MAKIRTPKFKVPFEIEGASAKYVEQDSTDEIAQCVDAVIRTKRGELVDEPEFGRPDLVFSEGDVDTVALSLLINEWEPRASFAVSEEYITETARKIGIEINEVTEA
jgi:phage baseplate assembly protein W